MLLILPLLIGAGVLLAGASTESGARTLWSLATRFLPGKLTGTVVAGTLADGLSLRDITYVDAQRRIRIDRLVGRWHLSLSPRMLDIAFLEIGKVDATIQPSESSPLVMPQEIVLPLAIDLHRATIAELALHDPKDAAIVSNYRDIRLSAGSDRVHHRLNLENAVTPFGTARAALRLDGKAPFAIDGNAGLATAFQGQQYTLDATLAGNLRTPALRLRAAGGKLTGSAAIDATPFDPIPFQRASIDIVHLDPKVYSPGAPHADLSVKATLVPVSGPELQSAPDSTVAKAGTAAAPDYGKVIVSGPIRLTNALPGLLDRDLLPLSSASADVILSAQRQQLSALDLVLPGGAHVTGSGELQAGAAGGQFKLQVAELDLRALYSSLQGTRLSGPVTLGLANGNQDIQADLRSKTVSIAADARIDARQILLRSARLEMQGSQLAASGTLGRDAAAKFSMKVALKDVDPAVVMAQLPYKAGQAAATMPVTATDKTSLAGSTRKSGAVQSAHAATLARTPATRKRAAVARATPVVHGRINLDLDADGALQPDLAARVRFTVHDSTYDQLPMTGAGKLQVSGKRLVSSDATLSVAGNDVAIKGGFGAAGDRLDFRIAAPALARLGFGLAGLLEASGKLAGTLTHPVVDATYKARGLVIGDHRLAQLAGEAHVDGIPGENPAARLLVTIAAQGVHAGPADLAQFDARIDGTYARHTIDVTSSGKLSGQPLQLTVAAQGAVKALPAGYAWDGVVRTLDNRGVPRVAIGNPLTVSAAPGRITLGATHLTLGPADIDLKGLQYRPGAIISEGSFAALRLTDVFELQRKFTGAAPPIKTSLALDGNWKFSLTDTATGFVQLERRSGDLIASTPYGESSLGLTALRIRADLQGMRMAVTSRIDATRIGSLAAQGNIGLVRADGGLTVNETSSLSGTLTGAMPQLRNLAALTGPQIALDGKVDLKLAATGTVGAPKFSGNVNGDGLALTLFDQGVRLKDGIARIVLDNNYVELKEVVFHGGAGTLRATGRIPLAPGGQNLTALIVADRLDLLSDPARQLRLSGQANMANVSQQLQITGRFTVDRALFSLPDKAAPKLGDDVIIVHQGATPSTKLAGVSAGKAAPANGLQATPATGRIDTRNADKTGTTLAGRSDAAGGKVGAKPEPEPASAAGIPGATGIAGLLPPRVNVTIDLGNSFRFKGAGADFFLAGALDVRSGPKLAPQAIGTIRVVSGTFESFGAKLAIERGLISFQGPFDNPGINILAMRRNQSVPAGVQVTGNVRVPRVELVSEPNLAEEEKLSWLVFGHAGSSTGGAGTGQAQGAVQSAALGLLNKFGGKSIASRVGLDQLSIGSSEYGKTGAQVVSLGKEISNKLFVGYEQGLAGASSVVKLTYELTQNWSLVARGGAVAGVDVFYSRRFDKLFGKAPPVVVVPKTSESVPLVTPGMPTAPVTR